MNKNQVLYIQVNTLAQVKHFSDGCGRVACVDLGKVWRSTAAEYNRKERPEFDQLKESISPRLGFRLGGVLLIRIEDVHAKSRQPTHVQHLSNQKFNSIHLNI